MKQYVYVMESASGLVKIGVAAKPEIRRAAIEKGSGFHVHVVRLLGPFNKAVSVELAAHAILAAQRRKGEWFACDAQVAIDAVEQAAAGFVDQPDGDSHHGEAEVQAVANLAASVVAAQADGLIRASEMLMAKYEALAAEYASLEKQFSEACELVDFYASHAKEVNLIAKKAFKQIHRLEQQVAELKAQPTLFAH